MHLPLLSSVVAIACACGGSAGRPQDAAASSPAAPALPQADAPQAIPPTFVLSTNEPGWQARVESDVVVLTGLQGQRRLVIDRNEAVFDGRVVSAHDSTGTLELRVTDRLCMDSMSGAQFPYTGRLQLDSAGAVSGCGGPLPAAPAG